MFRHALLAMVLLWGGSGSCSDDNLKRRAPRLETTIYSEGQAYQSYDNAQLRIELGEVPVFSTSWAIFHLENPTQVALEVESVTALSATGQRWGDAVWIDFDALEPDQQDRPFTSEIGPPIPFEIPPFGKYLVGFPYSPLEEGDHLLTAEIASNADIGKRVEVTVAASAIFTGEPDIEVQYQAFVGPQPEDCIDTDGDTVVDNCIIPEERGIDFGNISLNSQGMVKLVLRNTAECPVYLGVDACSLCSLTVAKNPAGADIGFGFKPDTDPEGTFSFNGSTATPFEIRQRNVTAQCDEEGEISIFVTFDAPENEGLHSTTIVIESNDPDEPRIEIPVKSHARDAPIAKADFRARDPDDPSAPHTEPDHIQPLDRVYFDGRESYDPRDPDDPALISAYAWEVLDYPSGLNPNDFQFQGANTGLFSFWVPIAGKYTVRLTVWNNAGIQSGDTPESRVEFDAVPGSRLHVQLVWEDPDNDQDLHLLYMPRTPELCEKPWDCHWRLKKPQWFTSHPIGQGPNPRLDIDDTNGKGPENINIDEPQPGTYRVVVHYWTDARSDPTRNTIRIYLNGLQVAEYKRTLNEQTMWELAEINWMADNSGYVTPFTSDSPGEIGTVTNFTRNQCNSN